MPLTSYEDWSVSLSSFVNLAQSSQSKSISLHVPGNCYLVTVSAAVAIGCAVDWGRRTESPFWWWVLLHQLRMRRRSRQWLRWRQQDRETVKNLSAASWWLHSGRTSESSSAAAQLVRGNAWEAPPYSSNRRSLFWQVKLSMSKDGYPVADIKDFPESMCCCMRK